MEQLKGHKNRQQEIITINVGGCGVNLAQTLNEQYCIEGGVSFNGEKESKTQYDATLPISFEETTTGKYIPRTLMIDMDPYTINNMKNQYKYANLFRSQHLISGKYDAANNWAIAHYSDGKELMDKINDTIRISTESCDKLQGFILNHSISGGTSGLMSLILERLSVDYRQKGRVVFQVFHDENKLSHPAQVYNALLTTNHTLQNASMSIIMDNKQIDNLCRSKLNIETPRYQNYNHLLTKLISSVTAPCRYGLNERLDSMINELVLQNGLHFMTPSISPIISSIKMYENNIRTLSSKCLDYRNFLISTNNYNVIKDKMIKLKLNYRGNKIKDDEIKVNETMASLANKEYFFYNDDTPSLKFIDGIIPKIPLDDMISTEKQVTMIANNPWISRLFTQRITNIYDILYNQKAYVHLYIGEGMEEGEFAEAREHVGQLEKGYLDILSMQPTEESDDDSDDSSD